VKTIGLGMIGLLGLLAGVSAAETGMRLSPKIVRDEVRTVVESELAALRKDDFETAYGFAAEGLRRRFDARMFGLMLKRGYAPLVRHSKADLGIVRDDGEGTALIAVTVTDSLNRSTVYRYWLVKEKASWRISGVRLEQRPEHGDI
jgi:hypothetical protein